MMRALVVGSGFGCRIQTPALRLAGFDVVGLVGSDAARTAERAAVNAVPRSFTDLARAIDETAVDAVAIATPPSTHSDMVLLALERGCHVLCEKPFATDLADARLMLDAAERAGRVHMIGHEFRFVPQRALVARTIAQGMVGEPRFMASIGFNGYVAGFAGNLPHWWFDPAAGGGWLGASASHLIDQIRMEVGEFAAVSAALPSVSAQAGAIDDSFAVRFRLANGVEGVLQQTAGAAGPPVELFRIVGSEGTLWTEGDRVCVARGTDVQALALPADLILPPAAMPIGDPRRESDEWRFLTAIELAPYAALCASFRAAILKEPAPTPVRPATFADGVAVMAVLDAIRASAAAGGALMEVAPL